MTFNCKIIVASVVQFDPGTFKNIQRTLISASNRIKRDGGTFALLLGRPFRL